MLCLCFFNRKNVVTLTFIIFSLFRDCKNKLVMRVVSSILQCERKKDTDVG